MFGHIEGLGVDEQTEAQAKCSVNIWTGQPNKVDRMR